MELQDITTISIGKILKRLPKGKDELLVRAYNIFSLQEFQCLVDGNFYSLNSDKKLFLTKELEEELPKTKKDLVVIHLATTKSLVITESENNQIISDKFAYFECPTDKLDPYYFMWYFNETTKVQRKLLLSFQGGTVKALSVQTIRCLNIELPPIEKQRKIGEIYRLQRYKKKLMQKKALLETLYVKQGLQKFMEEQ